MFSESTSSSDEALPSRTPFNAVAAAAAAQRERTAPQKRGVRRAQACEDDLEAVTYDEAQTVAAEAVAEATQRRERRSLYIGKLVEATRRRKEEQERVKERQLVREMETEGGERFLTRGYKRELKQREEEERRERESNKGGGGDGREVAKRVFYEELRHAKEEEEGKEENGRKQNHGLNVEERNGKEMMRTETLRSGEDRVGERKRRRSRFDEVGEVNSEKEKAQGKNKETVQRGNNKRGARRNDESAIAEYRRRYFERMERRLREGNLLWGRG